MRGCRMVAHDVVVALMWKEGAIDWVVTKSTSTKASARSGWAVVLFSNRVIFAMSYFDLALAETRFLTNHNPPPPCLTTYYTW